MSILLKVNGRDLSQYVNVQHEDGLDPVDSERIEPQFGGNRAFQEGGFHVSDAEDLREWTVPLILDAEDRAKLHALVVDIENDLAKGAQVEFATDAADLPTFFSLEAGELAPEYQYFLSSAGMTRGTLKLWTRPHGTTGTARTVASTAATGPLVSLPVPEVVGDRDALGQLEVRVGSQVASSGRIVGFGITRSASYSAFHQPTAANAQASSIAVANPTAVGSYHVAIPVSGSGASGIAYRHFLAPVEAHQGRHRVFAVARSGFDRALPIHARDRFGAVLGPTAMASVIDQTRFGLVDLGEIQVPRRASGQEAVPTQYMDLIAGGASGANIQATPAFHLNQIILLPLGLTPGLMRGGGGLDSAVLFRDHFTRFAQHVSTTSAGLFLNDSRKADVGVWSPVETGGAQRIGAHRFTNGAIAAVASGGSGIIANAVGVAHLGSAMLDDYEARIEFSLAGGASAAAADSNVIFLKDAQAVSHTVRFSFGPSQYLAITNSGGVVASAGIPTTRASGVYLGQTHRLVARFRGPRTEVWIGTAPAGSPALSASNALPIPGIPRLQVDNGGNVASGAPAIESIELRSLAASAPAGLSREYFRFESHPQGRAVQGNASVFQRDAAADFRGNFPRTPPVGSPGASGPARLVAFSGEVDNFNGVDVMDVSLTALERFTFLR